MNDHSPVLTADEFDSLREVNKGDAQRDPRLHWKGLVSLGAVRRLGELGLTASGIRRLAAGK
jgi:hypothetical protein